MSDFHDVLFPIDIARGSRGGPQFSTRIVQTASGYEARNIEWSIARGKWNVAFGVRDSTDAEELIAFYRARMGRAYAFRFRDPLDYRAVNSPLTLNSAGQVQLAKLYASGSVSYVRFISLPVTGTVLGLPGGATLDYTTGVVTGASAGTLVTFQFDCKCRFDTDHLDGSAIRDGLGSWEDIPVVEVR